MSSLWCYLWSWHWADRSFSKGSCLGLCPYGSKGLNWSLWLLIPSKSMRMPSICMPPETMLVAKSHGAASAIMNWKTWAAAWVMVTSLSWVAADSHVWIYFPVEVVVCVDICDLCCDRRPYEALNQGSGWFCPVFCWPWEKGPYFYWTVYQESWLGTTLERWPLYWEELVTTFTTGMGELVLIVCVQTSSWGW